MVESGWIKLHRKVRENILWKEKRRFSKFEAWIDLLLTANHKPEKIIINGQVVTVERGQLLTSEVKLAERWHWSRNTVRTFLLMLEKEQMATRNCTTKWTVLTIANYDFYQGDGTADCTADCTTKKQQTEQQKDNRLNTNKNAKNEKKKKKKEMHSGTGTSAYAIQDQEILSLLSQIGVIQDKWCSFIARCMERGMTREVVLLAIKRAFKTAKTFDGIRLRLLDWTTKGLFTIEAVKANDREYFQSQQPQEPDPNPEDDPNYQQHLRNLELMRKKGWIK